MDDTLFLLTCLLVILLLVNVIISSVTLSKLNKRKDGYLPVLKKSVPYAPVGQGSFIEQDLSMFSPGKKFADAINKDPSQSFLNFSSDFQA
jgi:hypothetical protein